MFPALRTPKLNFRPFVTAKPHLPLHGRAMSTHYDVIVVGSGQGGTPLSSAFAQANYKTALVESLHVGGCCVNEGCTPTKTMVASGRVAYLARRGRDYGVVAGDESAATNQVRVAMEKVRQRKRDIVSSFRGGSERRVRDAGIDLIMGTARFEDEKTLRVRGNGNPGKTITADRIFINVGERPAEPKLDGLNSFEEARKFFPPGTILDSTSVQEIGVVPDHLVVVGGGYVGLEFGQLFRRLGAKVTIIQRGKQLLPREDPEIAEEMQKILKEDGVEILLNTSPYKIRVTDTTDPAQAITLSVSQKDSTKTNDIRASHVLFAAGRVPNTDTLNLPAAKIQTTARGHVKVDAQLRTTNPRVWALGDVKGPPAFTHVSYDDYRILKANLIDIFKPEGHPETKPDAKPLTTAGRVLPYVVYTDPQLGHVGLHEAEARAAFPDRTVQTATMPMAYVARALEMDETRGLMKAVVDAGSKRILGFTCLGVEGGEIMAVVQMAMIGGQEWTRLRDAVWAHPSLAESLNNVWGYLK